MPKFEKKPQVKKLGETRYGESNYTTIVPLTQDEIWERIKRANREFQTKILRNFWSDFWTVYFEELYVWTTVWDGYKNILEDPWIKLIQYNQSKSLEACPVLTKGKWDYFDLTDKLIRKPVKVLASSQVDIPDAFDDDIVDKKWGKEFIVNNSFEDSPYPTESDDSMVFLFNEADSADQSIYLQYPAEAQINDDDDYYFFLSLEAEVQDYTQAGTHEFFISFDQQQGIEEEAGSPTEIVETELDLNFFVKISFTKDETLGKVLKIYEQWPDAVGPTGEVSEEVTTPFDWVGGRKYQIRIDSVGDTVTITVTDPISTDVTTLQKTLSSGFQLEIVTPIIGISSDGHAAAFDNIARINNLDTDLYVVRDRLGLIWYSAEEDDFEHNPVIRPLDNLKYSEVAYGSQNYEEQLVDADYKYGKPFFDLVLAIADKETANMVSDRIGGNERYWRTKVSFGDHVPLEVQELHPDLRDAGYFARNYCFVEIEPDTRILEAQEGLPEPDYNFRGLDIESVYEDSATLFEIDEEYRYIPLLMNGVTRSWVDTEYESGRDFDIVAPGILKFYNNLPHPNLFAPRVFREERLLRRHFGEMINFVSDDSNENYKNSLLGIYSSLWNGSTVNNILRGMNIALSQPFSPVEGVINKIKYSLSNDVYTISINDTDVEVLGTPSVKEGQTLGRFDPLNDKVRVYDYVNTPHWWRRYNIHPFERFFTFGIIIDSEAITDISDYDYMSYFMEAIKPAETHYIFGIQRNIEDEFPPTDDDLRIGARRSIEEYWTDNFCDTAQYGEPSGDETYGDGTLYDTCACRLGRYDGEHYFGATIRYGGCAAVDSLEIELNVTLPMTYGASGDWTYGDGLSGFTPDYGDGTISGTIPWPND